MDRVVPNLAVADGQSVVDAGLIDPSLLRSASMYSARLRGAPVGVPPQLALHAAARAPSAAPVGGVDWSFFLFVVGPLGPPRLSLALLRSSLLASARFLLSKTDCYVVSGSGFGERAQTENRDVRVAPGSGL